ncbi:MULTISPECIES: PQQ-dependent sugar dehydrogenase [Deefgea]|uniref:PQQ-dependent sugar dehydrogenase n=1 Tax=Deefgea chitinilytica TaxID=570276 RepID=A0ABS2CES8_9NEIS|nr:MULTISPECIES: PQQ-dependent sugar dehydrogenase [Deefgea]MBM5572649.1 PQQ-dependent sugar dehydrogenase [Deefgea chitinilytica]MBM9889885.1 PQQ-dependent sugar dehydrogenase [Deefgea sp. CFH1-16]
MFKIRYPIACSCLAVLTFAQAADEVIRSERHDFRVQTLTRGLAHPWGLAFLPDGRMLVTEREGRLRLISAKGELDPRPVAGVPTVVASGQGGLLDVALHPNFAQNRWVYFSYAGQEGRGASTQVARGQWLSDAKGHRLENIQQIYRQRPGSGAGVHFGSRLVFDRSGMLLITQGDRGEKDRAQQLNDLAGKAVRLHDDGRFPTDNPFRQRSDARPEVYSYGHRNMQGAAINPVSGELWSTEHGPQGGDELNIVRAGRNYGWPVITYGVNYGIGTQIGEGSAKAGMEQPIYQWTPSIAPSGLAFYQGKAFPQWQGNLFLGALKYQMLVRLELDGGRVVHEERLLKNQFGRIRDVRVGPDGLLYLLTDEADGALLRLVPLS